MTTRLRARWARAAAFLALIGTAPVVAAAPVAGAPVPIRILSVSAENVSPGDKVRVRFRVTNVGGGTGTAVVVVGGGLRCATGCRAEPSLAAGRSRDFETTLVAPKTAPGEVSGRNISVAVRLGGRNSFDHTTVYVHGSGTTPPGGSKPSPGADKPSTGVAEVSGRVRDAGGQPVGGAALTVRDSAGHEFRTTSDRSGRFSVRSSAGKPIAAGRITVVAAGDGYRTARTAVKGRAGSTVTARLILAAVAAPAATAPSPEPVASPAAAADAATGPRTSGAAAAPALASDSDEGGSSPLFMILGGLLVVAGLGALARVMIRRRNLAAAPVAGGVGDAPTAVLRTVPPAGGQYGAGAPDATQLFGHEPYGGPARRE